MLSQTYFDRTKVNDLANLLSRYPADEFASRTRSTVPLIALATSGSTVLRSVLKHAGFTEGASLHFEYRVAPTAGRGQASHTDLMVIEGPSSLAVEAKWIEPRYETARDWLGPNPTDNRLSVLGSWLSLINQNTGAALQLSDISAIPYQLVHRAASACASGQRPQLAYLEFLTSGRSPAGHRLEDLDRLYTALGRPTTFPFHLIQIQTELTSEFDQIEIMEQSQATEAVRPALLSGTLFRFPHYKVTTLPS